ncbi:MAG: hypothetical protein SGILL_010066 [Bacillariaceae sp.]
MISDDTRDCAAKPGSGETEENPLPLAIQEKDYSIYSTPVEADKQLWKDLEKECPELLEQNFIKYLFIKNGKAYVEMPSEYHEAMVRKVRAIVTKHSTEEDPILADSSYCMKLTTESMKYPDIFIFGGPRTENRRGRRRVKRVPVGDSPVCKGMNPHAIIEVSWTNDIDAELEKFALQINQCRKEALGAIRVGYLIKTVPLRTGEWPSEKHPNRPLWGLDIYRMEAPEDGSKAPTPKKEAPSYRWRHGEDLTNVNIELTADDLECGGVVSIPLQGLVNSLTDEDVKFESPSGG